MAFPPLMFGFYCIRWIVIYTDILQIDLCDDKWCFTSPLGFAGLGLMWLPQPSFGPIKANEWWTSATRTQRLTHENFDDTVWLRRDKMNTILLSGWGISALRFWDELRQFIASKYCRVDFSWTQINVIYGPACLFTGSVLAKHEGINNSCLSPDHAGTGCCLMLEQITN